MAEFNWTVDFARHVAVSEVGAVGFFERAPHEFAVVRVSIDIHHEPVSHIGLSHDALRAIEREDNRLRHQV